MMTRLWFALTLIMTMIIATTAFTADSPFARISAVALKAMEADGKEIAIIDPREEGVFGEAHLLYAVNMRLASWNSMLSGWCRATLPASF